jgi:hypothetical protein
MKKAILIALIVLIAVGIFLLLRFRGPGPGGGPTTGTAPDTPGFVITVSGSTIKVGDSEVTAEEAAARARQDGRPVTVVWDRAYTDAESALKAELLRKGVEISRESTVK